MPSFRRPLPPPPRVLPFLSSELDEYLKRYWAIMFTIASRPVETGHIRHYLSWYCTRLKVVELEHHVYANKLRHMLYVRANTSALPLLFVNQKLVGTINDVEALEAKRLLKDVLQFGFEWKVGVATPAGGGGTNHVSQTLNALPATYNDTELFRARYRGAPIARSVTQLPQLHPFHRGDDDSDSNYNNFITSNGSSSNWYNTNSSTPTGVREGGHAQSKHIKKFV